MSIHLNARSSAAAQTQTSQPPCNNKPKTDLYPSTLQVHSKNQQSLDKPKEHWLSKCLAAVLAFFKSLFCCSKKERDLPETSAEQSIADSATKPPAAKKRTEPLSSDTPKTASTEKPKPLSSSLNSREPKKQENKPLNTSTQLKPELNMLDNAGQTPTFSLPQANSQSQKDKATATPQPDKKAQTINQPPAKPSIRPQITLPQLKPQDLIILDCNGISSPPRANSTSQKDKVATIPQTAPAKKVQAISQPSAKSLFVEMEEELNSRRAMLENLEEEPSLLHYEGMNPFQARLEILKGLKALEQNKTHLLSLCKAKKLDDIAEFVATKLKLTIHTEFAYQVEEIIGSCVDTLHQAFKQAKANGKLDAFLVRGFCDPLATKPDGAPYDIEACLEAKIEEWKLWAQGKK